MTDKTEYEPKPGTIFLTRIEGVVGALVWLGQLINGDVSRWSHTGIVLDDGTVFEAQPSGSQIRPLYTDREVKYIDVIEDRDFGSSRYFDGEGYFDKEAVRDAVVRAAREHVGIKYSWATFLYLAVYRLNFPILTRLLRWRVSNSRRLICSQAVDHVFRQAGISLFNDGRLPFDVTPGDIARLSKRAGSYR